MNGGGAKSAVLINTDVCLCVVNLMVHFYSNPEKHSLEHSSSNSSTESAASSVDSNSTVSSEGSGCGSDGNCNGSLVPLCRKTGSGMFPRISAKLIRAQEFGLSPPSESKLLQRRYREGNNGNPVTGKKGNCAYETS